MSSFSRLALAAGLLAPALMSGAAATGLSFTCEASLHAYQTYKDGSADNNPPFCGMIYSSLDLDSVTAWNGATEANCGACLKVCGTDGGCKNLLLIDKKGGAGLDISQGAGPEICGSDTGIHQATAEEIDPSECEHIWNGTMYQDTDFPKYPKLAALASMIDGSGSGAPATTPAAVPSSTVAYAPPPSSTLQTIPTYAPAPSSSSPAPAPEQPSTPIVQPETSVQQSSAPAQPTYVPPEIGSVTSPTSTESSAPATATPSSETNATPPNAGAGGLSPSGAPDSGVSGAGAPGEASCNNALTTTVTVPGVRTTVYVTAGAPAATPDNNNGYAPPVSAANVGDAGDPGDAGDSSLTTTGTIYSTATMWITQTLTASGEAGAFTTIQSVVTVVPVPAETGVPSQPSVGTAIPYPTTGSWNQTSYVPPQHRHKHRHLHRRHGLSG